MDNPIDSIYAGLIDNILTNGETIKTRNSVCKRLHSIAYSFSQTPLVSIRKTAWKNALREWEWFMSGSCHVDDLPESVRNWWKPWANEFGLVRYNYSEQFLGSMGADNREVDQISYLVHGIIKHPYSRRNVITTWNTADMTNTDCKITNCHGTVIQAFVSEDGTLDLTTYQRSADVICGLPHNWIQYWAFLNWLAIRTDKRIGSLNWIGGDIHIYESHIPLARKILDNQYNIVAPIPELHYYISGSDPSWDFKADDFGLRGDYVPLILDKAEMIV